MAREHGALDAQHHWDDAILRSLAEEPSVHDQEGQTSGGGLCEQATGESSKGTGKLMQCQVQGCCTDLVGEGKAYCIKKRLCAEHIRADAVMRRGHGQQEFRFCFQCGKLEPLFLFDGSKRSCRTRLLKRRQPPKRSSTWGASQFNAEQPSNPRGPSLTVGDLQKQDALNQPDTSRMSGCQNLLQQAERQLQMLQQQHKQLLRQQQHLNMQHYDTSADAGALEAGMNKRCRSRLHRAATVSGPQMQQRYAAATLLPDMPIEVQAPFVLQQHSLVPGCSGSAAGQMMQGPVGHQVGLSADRHSLAASGQATAAAAAAGPCAVSAAAAVGSMPGCLMEPSVPLPINLAAQVVRQGATAAAAAATAASSAPWTHSNARDPSCAAAATVALGCTAAGQPEMSHAAAVDQQQQYTDQQVDACLEKIFAELNATADSGMNDADLEALFDFGLSAAGQIATGFQPHALTQTDMLNCQDGSFAAVRSTTQQPSMPVQSSHIPTTIAAASHRTTEADLRMQCIVPTDAAAMTDQQRSHMLQLQWQQMQLQQQMAGLQEQQLMNDMSNLMAVARQPAAAPNPVGIGRTSLITPGSAHTVAGAEKLQTLRRHFNAVQSLLSHARGLVQTMHNLDPASAAQLVHELKATLRSGGAAQMPATNAPGSMAGAVSHVMRAAEQQQHILRTALSSSQIMMERLSWPQQVQQNAPNGYM